MQCSIFKNSCIGRLVLINRCFVYLKYIQCAKTCKNVQKRASQVLMYQKTCTSRSHLPKNVQKRAKTCKNVQKRAKTCISNVFGPFSKPCIVKVRASWCHVSQGLILDGNLVLNFLDSPEVFFKTNYHLTIFKIQNFTKEAKVFWWQAAWVCFLLFDVS